MTEESTTTSSETAADRHPAPTAAAEDTAGQGSPLTAAELEEHIGRVVAALRLGRVIPFLGAGASIWNRAGARFDPAAFQVLPNSWELAAYLAGQHGMDVGRPEELDLVQVAEYIKLILGEAPLYDSLHELFDADYPPTLLHDLLAGLPRLLRDKGWVPLQLVVTTNYDDLLERAFRAAGEDVDVLTYMAPGEEAGLFRHFPAGGGDPHLITQAEANTYLLPVDEGGNLRRPAILKVHGAVDRMGQERDSFVITEDDYIEYLARPDITSLLPKTLVAKLARSHFLFLGYSLRDWNIRAILHRLWALQRVDYRSWAIQGHPEELDRKAWGRRNVDILPVGLDRWVAGLTAGLAQLPTRTATQRG